MKHVPELITTTFVLGGNAVLGLFDRTPVPDNESRRRELESLSGLYGDDLLQTIDVYANKSYRVLNQDIEKIWHDIHHEVATIHPTLRKRLQALSGSVGDLTERVHSHSVAALKLQQSIEESYMEFDNLSELREKIVGLQNQIQKKIQEHRQVQATYEANLNALLDDLTDNNKSKKEKVAGQVDVLDRLELTYERLRLSYLKTVLKTRTADKRLVNMRLELEEQKAMPRPYAKWTPEKLEEQQLQLKPKLSELRNQLNKLKDKYVETDRRSSMYRIEQESFEKELSRIQTIVSSTEHELQIHQDATTLDNKQKEFSKIVAQLTHNSASIDTKIESATHYLADLIVKLYKANQQDFEDLANYLFSGSITVENIPRLRKAFRLLQQFEALRLRNQQHFLRMDIWFNERKIKKLTKDLKEHKALGADKGSFTAAMKEIKQDVEKRRLKVSGNLQQIFQTHLELLLERHKQPKECLKTSHYAFEQACERQKVNFKDFKDAMWNTMATNQFETEQSIEDITRRDVIESCIRTKRSVIAASKVMKAKHAEVLLVASETPNLMHSADNLIKRRQKIQNCRKKLRLIETEVMHLLNN